MRGPGLKVVTRRTSFALVSLLASFVWLGDAMSGSAKDETMSLIMELGDLLAKLAEAVSKFGDSIAHLVTLGAQGYDAAAARKAHANLITLRVDLEKLVAGANMPLIKSINEYVEGAESSPRLSEHVLNIWWDGLRDKVDFATTQVSSLLEQINNIRSDFVLQDSYRTIQMVLNGRNSLLIKLRTLSPPEGQEELKELAKVGVEYQRLSDATLKASQQLATYISLLK
jgi:hypothetical protein